MSRIALIRKSSVNYISLLIYIWNNGDRALINNINLPKDLQMQRCAPQKKLP